MFHRSARVRPCGVPCVCIPCVSRLPPVSFYLPCVSRLPPVSFYRKRHRGAAGIGETVAEPAMSFKLTMGMSPFQTAPVRDPPWCVKCLCECECVSVCEVTDFRHTGHTGAHATRAYVIVQRRCRNRSWCVEVALPAHMRMYAGPAVLGVSKCKLCL